MALVSCRECAAAISDQSAACPRCGAPTRPRGGRRALGIALLLVGIAWAALGIGNVAAVVSASAPASDEIIAAADRQIVAMALQINGVRFLLPGLGLAALGALLWKRI